MKHVSDQAQEPERPASLEELLRNLNRRLSDMRDGWTRCDNRPCKRRKKCCGEGPAFKCTDDGSPPREISPEEKAKALSQLYHGIKARLAERAAGVPPMDPETLLKLRDKTRAAERPALSTSSPRKRGPIASVVHDAEGIGHSWKQGAKQ